LRTNEPSGAELMLSSGPTWTGRFVVHLHRARREHYDLRVEIGGLLKSFAIPRGPSLDPAERRLAIETEDHPLDYLGFEAVIPAGNYGAGPMLLWDSGIIRYLEQPAEAGLPLGKLDCELRGYKLRGRFALVRAASGAGDRQGWLFFKKRDAYAREGAAVVAEEPFSVLSGLTVDELGQGPEIAARLEAHAASLGAPARPVTARGLGPMLCQELGQQRRSQLLARAGWLYELKLDGIRIIAEKRGEDVTLWSRRGTAVTSSYPEIVRAVRSLPAGRVLLDGEIVAFDERGRPSFSRLGRRMHGARPGSDGAREAPVTYVVFDLLSVGERDLMPLTLVERKQLLSELVRGPGWVRRLDHLVDDGRPLYEFCLRERLEGVVAKRQSSRYQPGRRRSGDWVKLKCERDDEFVVVGLTRGLGARAELGALDVASYEGERLTVRGKVGSGFDRAATEEILERTRGTERATPAAEGSFEPAPRGRLLVEPRVVVSVRHLGWTEQGRLRFAVFRGIRDDVPASACRSRPADVPPPPVGSSARPAGFAITHRRKVFWPEEGITKGDLCDYYAAVADVILPYLRDRPVVLVRYPDGIAGEHFYQWNVPAHLPSWIRSLHLSRDEDGHPAEVFVLNDLESLLYVANLGCIPIHVLGARSETLDSCDFLTFDFDVKASTLTDAVVLAHSLKDLLKRVGLAAHAKTSGQSGLHVLAPLGPGVSFATARLLVDLLGRVITQKHPNMATMERRVAERGQRVYVDTGQTGRTRTIVAPYSVRAVPGATVSTPLEWDEVTPSLDPRRFTLTSVPARLAEREDPMRPLLDAHPDINRAVGELEVIVHDLGRST
jgi:bifunctional non-homologous end joining protein LigD